MVLDRKQQGPQRNSEDVSPINDLSPICFHLNCVGNGNDDIPSDDHFENLKTNRGSYLDLEVVIFVKIFDLSLVAQSL